jgi:uncharacterized protein (TIGR02996 family)
LLAAIRAAPEDDAPRLVYADWLEEHGDPARAEFIRIQCMLERLPYGGARSRRLREREAALRTAHEQAWLQELPAWARHHAEFRRGFVEALRFCRAADWLAEGADLVRRTPLQELHLTDCARRMKALAACHDLAHVRSLDLSQNGIRSGIKLLANSPHLTGLRRLNLDENEIGPKGVEAVAESPHLTNLCELRLAYTEAGEGGADALAASDSLNHLEVLDLQGDRIGVAGTSVLVVASFFTHLTELDLGANELGDEGMQALVWESEEGAPLTLHLYWNMISPEGAYFLADSPFLGRVVGLDLYGNDIGDEGASALAKSPHLTGIRDRGALKLGENDIGDRMARTLRKRFGKAVTLEKEYED